MTLRRRLWQNSTPGTRTRNRFIRDGRWWFLVFLMVPQVCWEVTRAQSTTNNNYNHWNPKQTVCSIQRPLNPRTHKKVYTVGVLAYRGVETAYQDFNATFSEYLSMTAGQRFSPPIRFEMKALTNAGVFQEMDKEDGLDFIYVHPGLFSCLEAEYEVQTLASIISRRTVGGQTYELNKFGGVITARADNEAIQSIHDLKDKIVGVVSIVGLGSGQMQFKQMIDAGMSYINDPKQLVFTKDQNKIVNGVLNGEFDVGFVRTDQIERTKDANGTLIDTALLKVIDPKPNLQIDGIPFPFQSSTQLYPEWNIAALKHVPPDVSREVQQAMLSQLEHSQLGDALQLCEDMFNISYCDKDDFFFHSFLPNNIEQQQQAAATIRCDSSRPVAKLARQALLAGKYAGWRTSLSYTQLRSMQESTGFMSYNPQTNAWRCVRMVELYDAITCPVGHIKKSKDEVDAGCDLAGIPCPEHDEHDDDYKCLCSPCYEPFVCNGANNIQLLNRHCVSFGILFAAVIIPVGLILAMVAHFYVLYKKRNADIVWRIQPHELTFDNPPKVLGHGKFGIVVLGDYHGTRVAVKHVVPPTAEKKLDDDDDDDDDDDAHEGSTVAETTMTSSAVSKYHLPTNDIESGRRRQSQSHSNTVVNGGGGYDDDTTTHHPPDAYEDEDFDDKLLEQQQKRKNDSQLALLNSKLVTPHFLRGSGPDGNTNNNSSFELKTIKGNQMITKNAKSTLIREMRNLSKLRHPCIATIMGAVMSKGVDTMLVMEFMACGSLYDLLRNKAMIVDGELCCTILRDITQGIRFLHSCHPQVIHGDLKAQNILVDSKFHAKVADFGLLSSHQKRLGLVSGTTFWMAPELLRGETLKNTAASDIYSLGMVLYELYSRKEPYEGEDHDDVLIQVCHPKINKRPKITKFFPPKVIRLMEDCFAAHPSDRPTAADIDLRIKLMEISDVEPRGLSKRKLKTEKADVGRSKNVLNDVFPKHIAEALMNGRKVEPESHPLVTICFIDIVGFTTISGSSTPIKVSDMLDRLFSAFDRLTTKHGCFKIETAGDSYMVTANLVQQQPDDHVKRMTDWSIDALQAASETLIDSEDPTRGPISIRVGMHSGPVVSNVVGSLNPKYGIFGDAVNIASRMESTSIAGKIQCSRRTATLLAAQAPGIQVRLRGKITVKGKGDMETYWVNDIE